jgi:hypothetical protein
MTITEFIMQWENAEAVRQEAFQKHQEAINSYFRTMPADRTETAWNNSLALGETFAAASEKAAASWDALEDAMRRAMAAR